MRIRPRTVAILGAVISLITIGAIALSSDAVRAGLAAAYRYPGSGGITLDEASSWTLSYLFLLGGAALLVALVYLAARRFSDSRAGWWTAAALTLVGLAFAVYNATQPFPLLVQVAGFLPVAAGAVWLALPGSGRPAPQTAAAR